MYLIRWFLQSAPSVPLPERRRFHSASITALYLTNDNTSQVIYGLFQSNSVVKTAVDYLAETQSVHTTSIDELFTSNATLRWGKQHAHRGYERTGACDVREQQAWAIGNPRFTTPPTNGQRSRLWRHRYPEGGSDLLRLVPWCGFRRNCPRLWYLVHGAFFQLCSD